MPVRKASWYQVKWSTESPSPLLRPSPYTPTNSTQWESIARNNTNTTQQQPQQNTTKQQGQKEAMASKKKNLEDDEEEGSTSNKKQKTSSKEPKELKVELGNKRFVSLSHFKGRTSVDIREFYEKDGDMLPGKKGISLTIEQWELLKKLIPEIDAALEK